MSNRSLEQDVEVYTLHQVDELIQHCVDGKVDIVRLLINIDTVNCVDNEGRTPLYAAACSGNVELCKYLLSSKADPNQQTGHDFYPIHGASSHGHDIVLSLLLKHTTGINAQDSNGDTALHLACCRGNEECVNLLLDAGSAFNVRNNMDKTPGMEAASNSHINIMQVLKDYSNSKDSAERSFSPSTAPPRSDNLSHKSLPFISSDFSPMFLHQPQKKSIIQNLINSGDYVDDARIVLDSPKGDQFIDCVIMNMLECFKPSQESLLAFRLSIVKELILKQDSGRYIVKEFFVVLHTLRKLATPEILQLIDKIICDIRIDNVFDLYTDHVDCRMRVNIDIALDTNEDFLFIRDTVSSKIELISFDAVGEGNFNVKIALLNQGDRVQFYDSKTERVDNEKLLKHLSKYDYAYQIPYHPCILQPSHLFLASTEDYLPFLNRKEIPIDLLGSAFFIITPILDTCLFQLFHDAKTKNMNCFGANIEMIILSFLSDCLLALEHLRQHGIVHRNISSQNIMVDMNQQRALLSNFSTCIELFDSFGKPYCFNDNNTVLFDSTSWAPELVYFSSLPQGQLSKLELRFVYDHVDAYSIGRSFYQNVFLEDLEAFPFQEYKGENIVAHEAPGSIRYFLEKVLLNLLSTTPQVRPEPLSTARLIFCLLFLKGDISIEPSDLFLTSLLTNYLTDARSLINTSLYFFMLCGKDEVVQAQEYYFNK